MCGIIGVFDLKTDSANLREQVLIQAKGFDIVAPIGRAFIAGRNPYLLTSGCRLWILNRAINHFLAKIASIYWL